MVQINNVNTQKFSLNGVEYFKNFTPIVVGNRITIVNTYDSKIVIVPLTLYSDFELDSIIYANVELLQTALLPVVFTRDTLGSAGDFLSKNSADYTAATLPLIGTEVAILNDGVSWVKITWNNIKAQLKSYFDTIYAPIGGGGGSFIRQQFVFSGSQTFTLSSNYGQVYSVSVQGQGALKDTQYTLVAPNQITILDTLDSGDYIVVLYSSSVTGVQPYYSQAETDGLLALKQNKFFSYKMTTPSISVTGTTSETELVKVTIPANTFSANDIIRIPTILMTKVGVNAAATIRLKISTSSTMPSAGTGQIAQFTIGATSLYQQVNRSFYINGGNLKGFPFFTAANTDIAASTTAMSTVAFDTTVTQYLYISGTLLSSLDSLRVEGLQIMNN